MASVALDAAEQRKPARSRRIAVERKPGRDLQASSQSHWNRRVLFQAFEKIGLFVEQKSDRPIAQHVMPERDPCARGFFPQIVEP